MIPTLLLLLQLPVFLQMPLTPDAVLYDLQAQCFMQGGVLYRDIVEPNLPGVVWIHTVLRSLFGESDQVLRTFDLVVVLSIAGILCFAAIGKTRSRRLQDTAMTGLASLLLMFYLGTSEWCHCQRDTWMLLPCLLAVVIRKLYCRPLVRADLPETLIPDQSDERSFPLLACLEGTMWGLAFWIKPFVAFPAIAVIFASRGQFGSTRAWLRHSGYLISAGAIVGLLGILWMVKAGCWTSFVDMMTSWNGDYYQAGRSRWNIERFQAHASRFWPWVLLHLPALVISVQSRRSLLCALYLGWLAQAILVQQLFDYVHVPGVILAITISVRGLTEQLQALHTTGDSQQNSGTTKQFRFCPGSIMASIILMMAVVSSMLSMQSRLAYFRPCLFACVNGSLPTDIRDSISQSPFPCWTELDPMINRLGELKLSGREVLAYNGNLIHLYPRLKSHPPTRFVYLDVLARCFPRRRAEMLQEIERSNIRFVVANLQEDGWEDDVPTGQLLPAPLAARKAQLCFPYNQRPIFRSGSYVLFEVDRPPGALTSDYFPLSQFLTKITATDQTHGVR